MRFFKLSLRRILFSFLCMFCFATSSLPQEVEKEKSNFKFSVFLNTYYGFDFNRPEEQKRLPFLFNHTRSDQFSVNLALITGNFEKGHFRANLALQQGTYAQDNYSEEPKALRWLNQANIGFALNQSKTVWLDVGLMPSHIGFENAISTENLTVSRSLIAENSPYFLTGGKLGWKANEHWYFSFWVANGWQVVRGISGSSIPSVGTQAKFSPSERLILNWSTLIGNNFPVEFRRWRYFSNQYMTYQFATNWNLIAGIDLGWEQNEFQSEALNFWSGGALILGYDWDEMWAASFRIEYYADPNGVLTQNQLGSGLKTSGLSLNLGRTFSHGFKLRVESRYLYSDSNQFLKNGEISNQNFFLLSSLTWQWN